MNSLLGDVRLVMRGWRWSRRGLLPAGVPVAPATPERFETEWARAPAARALREAALSGLLPRLLGSRLEVTANGLDRLEGVRGPVVFVANHTSHLDTLLVLHALPTPWRERTVVAAAADYFFDSWWRGSLVALLLNAVPLERHAAGAAQHGLAVLLAEGWSVLAFPEGTRSRDGQLHRFHVGPAQLALALGVRLVPIAIRGTFSAMPPGSRLPSRGGRVSVRFGAPLGASPAERPRALTARAQLAIQQLLQEDATTWWHALRHPPESPPTARWRRVWSATTPLPRTDRPPIWPDAHR